MSSNVQSPFALLFAQLSQSMSPPPPSKPVVVDVGYPVDAQHASAERVVFIPTGIRTEFQPFELPGMVTPYRQALDFDVSVYGDSFDRVCEIHRLLVAGLDVQVGPAIGAPPSDDAAPAVLRGVVDIGAFVYPYSGLVGLSLTVTEPGARALTFPSTPLDSPVDIALAVNAAALAASGPVQFLRARVVPADGLAQFLELFLPTDPLSAEGATLTLDPNDANSACAALGFSAGGDNISDTGAPPTRPYCPGYVVGDSLPPGVRGGDASSQGWGVIVPVTLFRPIPTSEALVGVIAKINPLKVVATGGATDDEIVVEVTT